MQKKEWDLREQELLDRRQEWESRVAAMLKAGKRSWTDAEDRYLSEWRAWERDFDKQLEDGNKEWDERIANHMADREQWQVDLKKKASEAASEDALTEVLGGFNTQLQTLAENAGISMTPVSLTDAIERAKSEIIANLPTELEQLANINESIDRFNTNLALSEMWGTDTQSALAGLSTDFRNEMGDFQKQMVVYGNAKMLEQYQKLMSDLLEQIERQNHAIEQQTEAAALGAGFIRSGNVYIKQSKLVSSAVGMVEAYQWYDGKAALDGYSSSIGENYGDRSVMNDLPKFLEDADTVQVESFFSVQKLILQKAFEKIMGTGTVSERKVSRDKNVIGELAWWIGKPAGSSEKISSGLDEDDDLKGYADGKVQEAIASTVNEDNPSAALDVMKYVNNPGFGELGSGGNRPSSIYLGFYNKLDLVSRYVDGKDADRMERIAGSIDPITATMNQFNPLTMLATSIQNVQIATQVHGKGAGYMWEAQLLSAVKTPLRVIGSLLVAAGTAVMVGASWTGIGALIGGVIALAGATVSATANSIHVDAKSGKRSYQMTAEGATSTAVDVVGGVLGGYAAAQAAVAKAATLTYLANPSVGSFATMQAAQATAQTASTIAIGGSASMGILQAGAEFDSRGRFTGQWSLEGSRGDSALIGAGITFVAAGTAGAAGLKQGTLASDLTKSGVSTGMNMMLQYQKMLAGHKNNYAGMAESDLSNLGSALGTVMQSQSQDWQNRLANALDRTHRASDSAAGLGVFARRDDEGNMRLDGAAQPAASAWGRFWKEGMSTLGGYGVLLGAIGSGIGTVAGAIGTGIGAAWDGLKYGYDKVSGWIGDGLDWVAGKYDAWEERRTIAKDRDAFYEKMAHDVKLVEDAYATIERYEGLAAKNEEISRRLSTVKGTNELAGKFYDQLKKDHPDWTYDQLASEALKKVDELKSALINNIAAEDVYMKNHPTDVASLSELDLMVYKAQKAALERSMAAFGMERLSQEELKEMGFKFNEGDKFSDFETKDGMESWLYRIPGTSWRKTQYILAFRGTEGDGDITADLGNGIGVKTDQYSQASYLAKKAQAILGDKGELSFTGHSLGGGLASHAATLTGGNAITFNAAGVPSTVTSLYGGSTKDIDTRVKAYYLNGDALSAVQDIPVYQIPALMATPVKYAINWLQLHPVILPSYLASATGERRQLTGISEGQVRSNFFQRWWQWGELHRNTNVMASIHRELE